MDSDFYSTSEKCAIVKMPQNSETPFEKDKKRSPEKKIQKPRHESSLSKHDRYLFTHPEQPSIKDERIDLCFVTEERKSKNKQEINENSSAIKTGLFDALPNLENKTDDLSNFNPMENMTSENDDLS